ncbi:MAG: SpoIIE family protein phosphatase [Gemmataceae bacterium]|nr:SpoIIE family protein phosphatase [Gemmataceae bacterium]
MPSLILVKSPTGASPGEVIPLDGDLLIVGRDAERCQIVIPHHAVSRQHVQITRADGQYFIEDLRSRNHTFVNSKEVTARTPLRHDDRIKICDFLFRFHDERVRTPPPPPPPPLPEYMTPEKPEEDESSGMTTIEATGSRVNAQHFLEVQPSDRLRALLEISTDLSRTLELDPLLGKLADTLLGVFKQADRCFVVLLDDAGKPIPRAQRARRPGLDETRFSRTIVKKALDSHQSLLIEDASADVALGPAASIAEFKIRSVMCVPVVTAEGLPLGAVQVDTQDRTKKFTSDDLSLLTIVANLAAVALEKARLHEQVVDRERVRKEIELARAVQLGFLPQHLPAVPGYEFYAHYSPAQSIGGDYYDFIPLPGGRLATVVADVAGKGVSAALLVAKLSSEARYGFLTRPDDPGPAVGLLNDQMIRGGLADRFVTLAGVVLDPAGHVARVANAGHPIPRLCRAGRPPADAVADQASGLPLGVMAGYEYESRDVALEPGDTLVLFTDGVTDAMDPGGRMFGADAADRVLAEADAPEAARPRKLGERLVQAVRRHAAGRPQNDDIAVVCVGRLAPGLAVTPPPLQTFGPSNPLPVAPDEGPPR